MYTVQLVPKSSTRPALPTDLEDGLYVGSLFNAATSYHRKTHINWCDHYQSGADNSPHILYLEVSRVASGAHVEAAEFSFQQEVVAREAGYLRTKQAQVVLMFTVQPRLCSSVGAPSLSTGSQPANNKKVDIAGLRRSLAGIAMSLQRSHKACIKTRKRIELGDTKRRCRDCHPHVPSRRR